MEAFRHGDFIIISFESCTQQEDPLGGMLFALTHLRAFCPTIVTQPICVLLSLADDTHIIGLASDVLSFFVIIGGIWSIRTFNVVDKVCNLVSIRFKLVYAIPLGFLTPNFGLHILGVIVCFFAICGILCIRGTLGGP